MSSSISNATSQPQVFQPAQNTPKQDAKANDQNTNTALTAVTKQVATTPGPKVANESASTRNSDGTYGPKHTISAPFNPLKASTNSQDANEASEPSNSVSTVNVKV